MPRKAKEKIEELNTKQSLEKNTSKKNTKATTSSKKTATKKLSNTSTKKKTSSKIKSTEKNGAITKKDETQKSVAKKSSTKKTINTKKTVKKVLEPISTVMEYYDLPFRYNQTVVKILAQTPNILFIYWDISDNDRKSYEKQYGKTFFENTRPVLIITNTTMNYTFEVEINDFANSWYLHINDANCDYKVELGRRFKTSFDAIPSRDEISDEDLTTITPYTVNEYIYITSSNKIEAPNDHILFDKLGKSVFFRNVKTNFIEEKNIFSLSYMQNMGKVYNIYDLYKKIYKDELISDEFGLNLPSSSSSTFK